MRCTSSAVRCAVSVSAWAAEAAAVQSAAARSARAPPAKASCRAPDPVTTIRYRAMEIRSSVPATTSTPSPSTAFTPRKQTRCAMERRQNSMTPSQPTAPHAQLARVMSWPWAAAATTTPRTSAAVARAQAYLIGRSPRSNTRAATPAIPAYASHAAATAAGHRYPAHAMIMAGRSSPTCQPRAITTAAIVVLRMYVLATSSDESRDTGPPHLHPGTGSRRALDGGVTARRAQPSLDGFTDPVPVPGNRGRVEADPLVADLHDNLTVDAVRAQRGMSHPRVPEDVGKSLGARRGQRLGDLGRHGAAGELRVDRELARDRVRDGGQPFVQAYRSMVRFWPIRQALDQCQVGRCLRTQCRRVVSDGPGADHGECRQHRVVQIPVLFPLGCAARLFHCRTPAGLLVLGQGSVGGIGGAADQTHEDRGDRDLDQEDDGLPDTVILDGGKVEADQERGSDGQPGEHRRDRPPGEMRHDQGHAGNDRDPARARGQHLVWGKACLSQPEPDGDHDVGCHEPGHQAPNDRDVREEGRPGDEI